MLRERSKHTKICIAQFLFRDVLERVPNRAVINQSAMWYVFIRKGHRGSFCNDENILYLLLV
jgi:hypothetical protein